MRPELREKKLLYHYRAFHGLIHLLSKKDLFATEKDLFEFLEENKTITDYIRDDIKERSLFLVKNSLIYHRVCLAILKKDFAIYYKKNDYHIYKCISSETTGEPNTEGFPIHLFFSCSDGILNFAYIDKFNYGINYYNKNHPFSQWLIEHQKELMEKVQGVYNNMIKTMIEERDKTEIMDFLNKSLEFLQKYQHNHFQINNDIFLKPEDFS